MKEEQKNKLYSIIFNILFHVVEIAIIIGMGIVMKVNIWHILILLLLFFIARMTSYKPMHYKSPPLCMIWSTLVFISFFLLTKVDLILAIVLTILEGIVLTGRGDIRDGLMLNHDNEQEQEEQKEIKKEKKEIFRKTKGLTMEEKMIDKKEFEKYFKNKKKISKEEYINFLKENR